MLAFTGTFLVYPILMPLTVPFLRYYFSIYFPNIFSSLLHQIAMISAGIVMPKTLSSIEAIVRICFTGEVQTHKKKLM